MTNLDHYLKITFNNGIYFLNVLSIESIQQVNDTHSTIRMNSGTVYTAEMTIIEIGNQISKLNEQ